MVMLKIMIDEDNARRWWKFNHDADGSKNYDHASGKSKIFTPACFALQRSLPNLSLSFLPSSSSSAK